jgi:tRNA(Ile2) C34 agmatinyltransferase TiaS
MSRMKPLCVRCGETYSAKRANAGYQLCMPCGEDESHKRRRTVAPMHKSNYMLITNPEDLKGLNNKGGFYR